MTDYQLEASLIVLGKEYERAKKMGKKASVYMCRSLMVWILISIFKSL